MTKVLRVLEYIWIDGTEPTAKLRSKTMVTNTELVGFDASTCPEWSFDGSSTSQASGTDSDVVLKPVAVYNDPFRGAKAYLVLCETFNADGTPHLTNTRHLLSQALSNIDVSANPWIGFEQEYTLFKGRDPLGWPQAIDHRSMQPPPQGPYYCGVGADEVFGRDLAEGHLQKCISIGIMIGGINAEVMPGQWEFQVGYRNVASDPVASPLKVSDDLWIARWILYRAGENLGISATLDVKPMAGDWNGAGMHANFSTAATRKEETGLTAIWDAISCLEENHDKHIAVYGDGLGRRLTGAHETCHMNEFRAGVSDRGASVRIPRHVAAAKCGYLEDRRPGANADPYVVSEKLVSTICSREVATSAT